jgi:hypothetical protein
VVELAGDASGSGRSAELAGCSGPWGADVVELAEGSACVVELAGLATGCGSIAGGTGPAGGAQLASGAASLAFNFSRS